MNIRIYLNIYITYDLLDLYFFKSILVELLRFIKDLLYFFIKKKKT